MSRSSAFFTTVFLVGNDYDFCVDSFFVNVFKTQTYVERLKKNIATRMVTKQVVKYFPVLGQIASAVISFAAMKYVGNSHVNECYQIVHQILEAKQQDIFDVEFVEKQEEETNAPVLSNGKEYAPTDRHVILETIR